MSERYIIIPADAKFIDPHTKEPVPAVNEDWRPRFQGDRPGPEHMVNTPDRSFDWFLHVYILSHQIFSMELGGYDNVKAMKNIAKNLDVALEDGDWFFMVTNEQHRLMKLTMARLDAKDEGDAKKVAKSSRGMVRKMSNFEAGVYMDFMDAIMNAQTNPPDVEKTASKPKAKAKSKGRGKAKGLPQVKARAAAN